CQTLGDVGLKTLADAFSAGQFTDSVSALINALQSQGDSPAIVVGKLEKLGISNKDAEGAVKGFQAGIDGANKTLASFNTAQVQNRLNQLQLQAKLANASIAGLGDHLLGTSDDALVAIPSISSLSRILASLPTEQRINVLVT